MTSVLNFSEMRERIGRWVSERPDTEHSQHVLRYTIISILCIYGLFGLGENAYQKYIFFLISYLYSIILTIWLVSTGGTTTARRIAGLVGDTSCAGAAMMVWGEHGGIIFSVYVWSILGYGIRFRGYYGYYTGAASIVSYALVVSYSDYYSQLGIHNYTAFIILIIVPLYSSVLTRQREKSEQAKTEFLSNISHEFRNPLNAIVGQTALLQKTSLTREQCNISESVKSNAGIMNQLVDDLLDISKIRSSKITPKYSDFDLYNLFIGTSSLLEAEAKRNGLEFTLHLDTNLSRSAYSAPDYIKRTLLNFGHNAIKYTIEGSVRVQVKQQSIADGNLWVRCEVSDTGPGISRADLKYIFDPFYQVDKAISDKHRGTGLGTSISKGLIESIHGRVSVSSTAGKGSTFSFEFPIPVNPTSVESQPAEDNQKYFPIIEAVGPKSEKLLDSITAGHTKNILPIEELSHKSQVSRVALTDKLLADNYLKDHEYDGVLCLSPTTISCLNGVISLPPAPDLWQIKNAIHVLNLVATLRAPTPKAIENFSLRKRGRIVAADDEKTNQLVLRGLLEPIGCDVELFENGVGVKERILADSSSIDLIILDIQMPIMSGLDVAIWIREQSKINEIPIVVLTGDTSQEIETKLKSLNITLLIHKPLDPEHFAGQIAKLLPGGTEIQAKTSDTQNQEQLCSDEILDKDRLDRLVAALPDGSSSIKLLIDQFKLDSAELLDNVSRAILMNDDKQFSDAIHSLKGSSGNIGAKTMSQACGKLGATKSNDERQRTLIHLYELHVNTLVRLDSYIFDIRLTR